MDLEDLLIDKLGTGNSKGSKTSEIQHTGIRLMGCWDVGKGG